MNHSTCDDDLKNVVLAWIARRQILLADDSINDLVESIIDLKPTRIDEDLINWTDDDVVNAINTRSHELSQRAFLRAAANKAARVYQGRDWHDLSPDERGLCTFLELSGYLMKNDPPNGFVGRETIRRITRTLTDHE